MISLIKKCCKMKNIKSILLKIYRFFKYRIYPLENFNDSPDYFRIYRYFSKKKSMIRFSGGWIYKGKKYPDYLFMGGASFAIFGKAKLFLNGNGVDIGPGYWEFPDSIPIDTQRGKGLNNCIDDFKENSLDYIFSSHCLEHIVDWKYELNKWVSKLKKKGRLFLYLPHPDCEIWHPGAPGIGDGHKWIPDYRTVAEYLEKLGLEIIFLDKGPDSMMSFALCAEKL